VWPLRFETAARSKAPQPATLPTHEVFEAL
jgi:hypothetical protein